MRNLLHKKLFPKCELEIYEGDEYRKAYAIMLKDSLEYEIKINELLNHNKDALGTIERLNKKMDEWALDLRKLKSENNLLKDLNDKLTNQLKLYKIKLKKKTKKVDNLSVYDVFTQEPKKVTKFSPGLQEYMDNVILGQVKPPLKPLPGDKVKK